LGLAVTELVDKKILTWPQLVERMSARARKDCRLAKKGALQEGFDGDLTIIDPEEEWEVKEEEIQSKSKNTPFIGGN